jgi:hypothetical protein
MILSGKDIHLEESKAMSDAGAIEAENHADKDRVSEWEVTSENGRKYFVRGTIWKILGISGTRTSKHIIDGIDKVRVWIWWGSNQLETGSYTLHECRRIRPESEQST